MITKLLAKIFGTANLRQLRRLQPLVNHVNTLESTVQPLTDEQLAAKTNEFREQLAQGKSLEDILPEAFAVVREVANRKLSMRLFDVQILGGVVLHQGKIAEMKTGEGKTLTATLPLYLNALTGKGTHLVTVNEYLANRDAEWMGEIYRGLGLSVAALRNAMSDQERKDAYQSDILYATNSELGFDYLRDNMKFRLSDYVQRDLNYAIVDEVDSILIDEARTPLIISGPSGDGGGKLYGLANRVVRGLQKDADYEIDIKERNVQLSESGVDKVESAFGVENLYAVEQINLLHRVSQALRANAIFKRDVDYVVRDNQVLIVDEFTGRILSGRRYSDGLHQALEAKETVEIERESQTLASITLQNLFRLYKKLAGMTGTAATEAEEFHRIYKLDVICVPTNKPMIRDDKEDLIFLSEQSKFKAIIEDLQERYAKKQPVLIGTVAIEKSELLSNELRKHGIPHEVLNAKQHEREAHIVEHAGQPGNITIATNMAGRGTDIKLPQESIDNGGLYILGTERHESRRIDNQLRGRSGRQGDPGDSRFYISLEDDLIRRFAGDQLKERMQRWAGMTEDEVIEDRWVSKIIEQAQEKVEKHNFEIRKHLLDYDDVLNQHRNVIYRYRRDVLEGEEQIYELIRDQMVEARQDLVARTCPQRKITQEQIDHILDVIHKMTALPLQEVQEAEIGTSDSDVLKKDLINFLLMKYKLYRERAGIEPKMMHEAEKWLLLETIDTAWKQHMLNIDHLREGINLRSYGQKNPLIEYKREAFSMFQDMLQHIRWEVTHHIFHLNIAHFNKQELERKREQELAHLNMLSGGADAGGVAAPKQQKSSPTAPKVGRNDPCPCGSGKKFKRCCGE